MFQPVAPLQRQPPALANAVNAAVQSGTYGWRVYGLGVMALGMVCLAWGDFDPGQPVPKDFPDRTALAYAAAAFMIVAGAAVEWRRTAAWAAAALTVYYALVVVILMDGRLVLAHYAEFGSYSGTAEQLAIAAAGLIVYAANAKIDAARIQRVQHAKIFRDLEGAVVRQQHAARPDANVRGFGAKPGDQDLGGRAGKRHDGMMFRDPMPLVAEFVSQAGQLNRIA